MIRIITKSSALLLLWMLASCTTVQVQTGRVLAPLYYETDRLAAVETKPKRIFSRRVAAIPSYGLMNGSLGPSRTTLSAPPCSWTTDSERRHHAFEPTAPVLIDPKDFTASIDDAFQKLKRCDSAAKRTVILYIHGFNNSFVQAATRTARFAFDLPVKGVPIFYSWPSQGHLVDYTWDATFEARAEPNITRLIETILDEVKPDQFHIVAHSMGSRAALRALIEIARQRPDLSQKVTSLTLLSADIDRLVFQSQIVPWLPRIANRVSLYGTSKDRALALSKRVNGGRALGDFRDGLLTAPHLVTIDTTPASHSWLHHADFDFQPSIMREIAADLSGIPPERRPCLQAVGAETFRLDPKRENCPSAGPYPATAK